MWLAQGGLCGCGCGEKLVLGNTQDEHTLPVALWNESKPDKIFRLECAKLKTRGDIQVISKAKRQGGETGQQRRRKEGKTKKIRSPGFSKTLRKKMNGKVERK